VKLLKTVVEEARRLFSVCLGSKFKHCLCIRFREEASRLFHHRVSLFPQSQKNTPLTVFVAVVFGVLAFCADVVLSCLYNYDSATNDKTVRYSSLTPY